MARAQAERAREEEATARVQAEGGKGEKRQPHAHRLNKPWYVPRKPKKPPRSRLLSTGSCLISMPLGLADVKYREGNLRNVRQLLRSCPPDLRNWEWYRLNYLLDEALLTLAPGFPGQLRRL